jgi:hypothetical protein
MKRFLTLLAAVLVAALPALRAADYEPTAASRDSREYQLRGFDGLNIGWTYKVELNCASRYGVTVEAPDFIFPYLKVEVRNGILVLDTKELPRDIRRKIEALSRSGEIHAIVSMPELTTLSMSGASQLTTQDEFRHRNDHFSMRLSGATNVRGLSVKAVEAVIECSGAAKFNITGELDRVDLELSGAANGTLAASPKMAELELSGAVKLFWKGNLGKTEIQASGAVSAEIEGAVNELKLDGSGAAKVNTAKAPSRNADIRLSGAAKCEIDVRESLNVSLSGATTCRYHASDRLRISTQSISRGSSLTRF